MSHSLIPNTIGARLYEKYAQLMIKLNNCEVDPWEELPHGDQLVWQGLAEFAGVSI